MDWNALIELLGSGGYGIALICIFALVKKDCQLTKIRDDSHEEFVSLLKENIKLLSTIRDNMNTRSK